MSKEELVQLLREVIGEVRSERPEMDGSNGNFDDSYTDGMEAAYYDIYHALKNAGVEL